MIALLQKDLQLWDFQVYTSYTLIMCYLNQNTKPEKIIILLKADPELLGFVINDCCLNKLSYMYNILFFGVKWTICWLALIRPDVCPRAQHCCSQLYILLSFCRFILPHCSATARSVTVKTFTCFCCFTCLAVYVFDFGLYNLPTSHFLK